MSQAATTSSTTHNAASRATTRPPTKESDANEAAGSGEPAPRPRRCHRGPLWSTPGPSCPAAAAPLVRRRLLPVGEALRAPAAAPVGGGASTHHGAPGEGGRPSGARDPCGRQRQPPQGLWPQGVGLLRLSTGLVVQSERSSTARAERRAFRPVDAPDRVQSTYRASDW
jgi:hypothetical protein